MTGYKGQPFDEFCQELAQHGRYQVGDHLWVREAWGLRHEDDVELAQRGVTPGQVTGWGISGVDVQGQAPFGLWQSVCICLRI